MLRIGIGIGAVIALFAYIKWWWLPEHDAAIYAKARVEIARQLQEDAAEKERAAIEAEDSVSPTPDDPKALAALCEADPYCRDRKAPK
jgi:hypothetical protein